uniref:Uncharacterized protein n=1 Tax=Arundo donax TaxID=35708 RepID=A0A0A9BV72_ARUDO
MCSLPSHVMQQQLKICCCLQRR